MQEETQEKDSSTEFPWSVELVEVDSVTGLTHSGSRHSGSRSDSFLDEVVKNVPQRGRQRTRMSVGYVDVEHQHNYDDPLGANVFKIVAEGKSNQDEKIRKFVRNSLIEQNQKKITRSELQDMLLDTVGVLINDNVLNQIYDKADKDSEGLIDAEDLANYINGIRPKTKHERTKIVLWRLLKSMSFWCSLCFFIGSLSNVITNLRGREYGDLYAKDHYYYQIGSWGYLIGSFGFVFVVYDFESAVYERIVLTNQKLVKWIKQDFPRFYFEKMNKLKSSEFLQSGSSRAFTMSAVFRQESQNKGFNSDIGIISLKQLRLFLESSGTFLAYDELVQIFKDSGMNIEGTVTVQDLIEFAEAKQVGVSKNQKNFAVLSQCIRNVGFWTSTCFVIGSIPFVPIDFLEGPDELITHLVGIGCVLYFAGALGGTVNVYRFLYSLVSAENRVDSRLRALAVKLGLLVSQFDKKLVRSSTVKGVTDYHIGWLNEFESREYQRIGACHLFDVVGQSGEKEVEKAKLYSVLIEVGVFISSNDFEILVGKLDTNEDGHIICSNFIKYIEDLDPEISEDEIRAQMLAMLPTSISFWLVLIQICAAALQVTASYNNFGDPRMTSNLFLAGSCGWLTTTGYNLNTASKTEGEKFDQTEESKFLLKESIVQASRESTENSKNINRVRTSQVLAAVATTAAAKETNRLSATQHSASTSPSTAEIWTSLAALSTSEYQSRRHLRGEHINLRDNDLTEEESPV